MYLNGIGAQKMKFPNSRSGINLCSIIKLCGIYDLRFLFILTYVLLFCSGECGMFAIKHIEYMMTGRDTKSITTEKMPEFRNEWSLNLFYQAILMCNND